ncbi:bifunctional adenosylcobinamide kinase/adenosylcobinamide-phosphate guanylyltransferase [Shewanella oncorhynchi]|uniref:bifunctional adenosylcobinamide kinase/adenosylcobinamide-phosphate guanylyltransferase n=1 Tax=Shewanella oncorhynchi TaxID=2726434 RepID=UPI003D7AE559
MIHLVLGGARSGKSRYGEALVRQYTALGFDACYVATAQALDDEMATRIAKHQAGRADDGIEWQLFEESLALTALLKQLAKPGRVILVDCLTLWLTNQLLASNINIDDEPAPTEWNATDFATSTFAVSTSATSTSATSTSDDKAHASWQAEKTAFVDSLVELEGVVILISNEVGSGIVPLGELSRQFVDEAGWLNQAVATLADNVTLVVAGLPLALKPL